VIFSDFQRFWGEKSKNNTGFEEEISVWRWECRKNGGKRPGNGREMAVKRHFFFFKKTRSTVY
jgi:hypothetical protein